jgi:hypothetical protein
LLFKKNDSSGKIKNWQNKMDDYYKKVDKTKLEADLKGSGFKLKGKK